MVFGVVRGTFHAAVTLFEILFFVFIISLIGFSRQLVLSGMVGSMQG